MSVSTAVDQSQVSRVTGIKTTFKDLRNGRISALPQSIAVVGQGSTASVYSNVKKQVFSALEVAQEYGFGSPLHLAVCQLLPPNGDGVGNIPVNVYPLDDAGGGVVADGSITPVVVPTAAGSYQVNVSNILSTAFTIAVGDTIADVVDKMVAAINGVLSMPIIAVDGTTLLTFTSKWKGASANDIVIEVIGPTTIGNSFTIVQANAGASNPDVDSALAQIGDTWETVILNCMDIADTTTLDKFSAFGEGRWGALFHKPCVVFTGVTIAAVSGAIAVSNARKTDRVNAQLVAPGSDSLPFVVAARGVARIAVVAQSDPASDYARQYAQSIAPGTDAEQWDSAQREAAVVGGSSTSITTDGVVTLMDTVTFYHPTGDPTPAYRFVKDIMRLQVILFNIAAIFDTPEWAGAPLIPNDQPTANPNAKKPMTAVAAISAMLDNLGLAAIISDPETAKKATMAAINGGNPNRLDVATTVQLSGNTNIKSIDLNFGFYFGTAPIV